MRDGCEQFGAAEVPGHRLTVCNINVKNIVLLKEIEDVVGRVECDLAGESIGQDSHPNRDGSGNDCPVRSDLDVVILVVLVLFVVLILFVVPVLFDVLALLNPAETNKVDGRMLDVLLVEQFNNLGTNVSPQIVALREGHQP